VVASYLAGRDIATESDTTGINSDIATTDQITPIATTTPIIIHPGICIPHRAYRYGFAYFFAAQREVVHRRPK
jgi:hypothetical protein